MCGIAGFYLLPHAEIERSDEAMRSRLERMGQALSHRGPDGHGSYLTPAHPHFPRMGMHSRRLAIIDRAHGQQPVCNEDGTIHAVLNGEIYNYRALQAELRAEGHVLRTESDAEVLVHLFEMYNIQGVLARLTGMYAFALWDDRTQMLYLARDPLGEKPLYYRPHYQPKYSGVDFASELKGLLVLPETPRTLDPVAIGQYLIAEAIPAPRTPYKGIFKLEPGQILLCDPAGLRRQLHWKAPEGRDIQAQRDVWQAPTSGKLPAALEKQLLQTLETALDASVEARLMGEVPVGVLLSGGLDSSLVAASMRRHRAGWPSFSMGFEEKSFDESSAAATVARHLQLDHHPLSLKATELPGWMEQVQGWLDEPLADGSLIPTSALMKAVRQAGVVVALSGDGGDESLGGYPTYLADRLLGGRPALTGSRLGAWWPFFQRGLAQLPASHENLSWGFKLQRTLEGMVYDPAVRHGVWMAGWLPQTLRDSLHPAWQELLRERWHEGGPGSPTDIDHWWQTSPLAPSRVIAKVLEGHGWPERAQLHDLLRYLPDDLLVKTDRASMAFGVEVRAPLLDPALVRLGLMLPPSLKLRGLQTKVALRLLGKKRLPSEILARPKKGFGMPTAHWLKQLPEALLWDWLTPPSGQVPLVKPEVLEGWVKAHRAGRADHRKQLWPVVMFERWRKGPWGG